MFSSFMPGHPQKYCLLLTLLANFAVFKFQLCPKGPSKLLNDSKKNKCGIIQNLLSLLFLKQITGRELLYVFCFLLPALVKLSIDCIYFHRCTRLQIPLKLEPFAFIFSYDISARHRQENIYISISIYKYMRMGGGS